MAIISNTDPYKILVINPNTSTTMTEGLITPIEALSYYNTSYTFYTNPSPSGPGSIDNVGDAEQSTHTILPSIEPLLDSYDAFLVACFSPHPLVHRLQELIAQSTRPRRPVTGIFEAAIAAATEYTPPGKRWAIVTTAETWREPLARSVGAVLGFEHGAGWDHRIKGFTGTKFGGVETTGLTAGELHDTPREIVDRKMAEALGRLIDVWESVGGRIGAVVLGCAGMVGWEEKIRREMRRRYPDGNEGEVLVVDPVKAGVGALQNALRAQF